jgi:hypothetical protein
MSLGLPGAEPEHFTLLRLAGIDRFEQLRNADPQVLRQVLAEANARNGIVPEPPEQDIILGWINQAKRLTGELPRAEDRADQETVEPGLRGQGWSGGERTGGEEGSVGQVAEEVSRDREGFTVDEEIFRDSPGDPGKDDW